MQLLGGMAGDDSRVRLVLAPMVDASELPFRLLCRAYGADLCFTPMMHAKLFVNDASYRRDNLSTCPQDRPLVVQFCANDPDTFAAAAKLVEDMCDGVDLNLGCPQGIARKGRYGAFLQEDWDLVARMVRAASAAVAVPISCKIRVFPDPDKTVRYAQCLVAAGAKLLTVHGRTREMKGCLTGLADWKQIRAVKQAVSVPVFANGNVQLFSHLEDCIRETGADGVMVAEALLHNPAFFSSRHLPCWRLASQYLQLYASYPTHTSHARAHLFKMLHHVLQLPDAARLRLALTQAKTIQDMREVVEGVRGMFDVDSDADDPCLEMSTLPVPIHVAQPLFRTDRTLSVQDVNRSLDTRAASKKERPVTKKMKTKCSKQDRVKHLELCVSCGNPRGLKCLVLLCKSCCRAKGDTSCTSHHKRKRT